MATAAAATPTTSAVQPAAASNNPIEIGVLADLTGVFLLATQLALQDQVDALVGAVASPECVAGREVEEVI